MVSEVTHRPESDPVRQFSVFTDNRVGRLHELVQLLAAHDVHVVAISQLDTTECNIIRLVVNYHEAARDILREGGYTCVESELLAVELDTEARLRFITAAFVEAEINVHYLYPFLSRPGGRSALAVCLEDNDLARCVLEAKGIKVLDQRDIAR